MKTLQWSTAGTILWLLVSYNIAKLYDVSAPHPWIGLAAALPSVAGALVLSKQRLNLFIALPALISIYALVKTGLVYLVTGQIDHLSVPELAIVACTLGLGLAVLAHLESLQRMVNDLFGGALGGTLRPFSEGQDEIYREIRRARVYQRPLTLIVFAHNGAQPVSASPFERQVRRELMDHAAAAHVSALLAHERTDCETVVQYGEHLITAFPALVREDADKFATRFAELTYARLGLKLQFGCATFPDDGLTFESLLLRAEAAMRGSLDPAADNERIWAPAADSHVPAVVPGTGHGVAVATGQILSVEAAADSPQMSVMLKGGAARGLSLVRSLRSRGR